MDSIKHQKDHFNSIAFEYYSAHQHPNTLLFKSLLWGHIFKHITPRVGMSVLEPMCGYAKGEDLIKTYYCENIDYTGFDYSENIINLVKQSYPAKSMFVQDVTTFNPDSQYDMILIIGGLHHVPDFSMEVLNNLKSGLAADSLLISFEPTHGNRIAKAIRSRIYHSNPVFDSSTERDCSVDELNKMYSDAGYEIVHQFYPGLLAYSLYYNPDVFPRLSRVHPFFLKLLFAMEKTFYKTRISKLFSFATLTVLQRSDYSSQKT